MVKLVFLMGFCTLGLAALSYGQGKLQEDIFKTSGGDLKITFIGHSSLIFAFGGKVINVDPYGTLTDYAKLPKADLVLITHEHSDHLDQNALAKIRTPDTQLVLTEAASRLVGGGIIMRSGETKTVQGFKIEAVPAYNIQNKRPDGNLFHPKGVGNGYVITFGDKRVYVAGDTENTPEMKALKDISIAFLPMNLPYTMTPEMVADAAAAFKPEVLYPYHYGDTVALKLTGLVKGAGIEVRIRNMK